MAHCIVSLRSAGRFEKENGIDWDLVCTDDKTSKKNSENEKGMFYHVKVIIIIHIFVIVFIYSTAFVLDLKYDFSCF